MSGKHKFWSVFLILTICLPFIAVGTETPVDTPFIGLSDADLASLEQRKPIIRSVKNFKELSLSYFDEYAIALRDRLANLKPNYITELLLIVAIDEQNKTSLIFDRLAAAVADVNGYVKIPYWSVKQQTTYDLFDKMEIQSRLPISGGETIKVLQHMEPFDDFTAQYEYSVNSNSLKFSAINLQPIVYTYRNLKAVNQKGMIWELYAFTYQDKIYVYGVGGVAAFDFFGLFRDRLEPSFMGRVASFFKHISNKIQ
jgi:hypothetical protein